MLRSVLLVQFVVLAHGWSSDPICDPTKGCNVCSACCQSYITPTECPDCAAGCPPTPAPPAPVPTPKPNVCLPAKCNVCETCCQSYLTTKAECDACVHGSCTLPPTPVPTPTVPTPAPAPVMYSCNATVGQCKLDPKGSQSPGECIATCTSPTPVMYSCNATVGQCAQDPKGSQSPGECIATCKLPVPTPTPTTCEAKCIEYACNAGRCLDSKAQCWPASEISQNVCLQHSDYCWCAAAGASASASW
jgi:hypothetical protein